MEVQVTLIRLMCWSDGVKAWWEWVQEGEGREKLETVKRAKSSKFFFKGKERCTVVAGEEALPREGLIKIEITACFYADGMFRWGLLE